jgi:hypothetical protein
MNVVADITHNSANKTAETRQFPMADNIWFLFTAPDL